ncbi:MAG: C39 family peptidase [Oscillospiraceae bacterium]|nr:C39 family peptidase [Oscillospiraceae bacterium]
MKYKLPVIVIAIALVCSFLSCTPKEENLFEDEFALVTVPDIIERTDKENISSTISEEAVPENTAPAVTTEPAQKAQVLPSSHTINMKYILQKPELPTGCEVTSLAMVLNYNGYDITKTALASDYMTRASLGKAAFSEAFIGNPASDGGYGCYAPVIVATAQKYLIERTTDLSAWDVSGTDFRDLFRYIDEDTPVIVWASMNLMEVTKTDAFYDESGNSVSWFENEHCMVLCGYNTAENTVTAADPLKGMMKYNLDRFETIYNQLEKQAVIVK